MTELDTSPAFDYYFIAPTSSEMIGTSDTVAQLSSFDFYRNATWLIPQAIISGKQGQQRKRSAQDLGWDEEKVASLRARQSAFQEGWNAPGMEDYNDL